MCGCLSERPETPTTFEHDVPVFRDVEADVDEASDVVCNVGLDIGDIVVEHGEIEEEEGRIARFLAGGCSCKLHDGTPCCTQFTVSMLQEARAECRQLSREQLDMVVMGQLRVLCQRDSLTQRSKARNFERKRTCTLFNFQGHRVCRDNLCSCTP